MIIILGAGLTGLSCSYHIGHEHCLLLEESDRPFGRIAVHLEGGFTWDQGPHVSFTKNEYVRSLFQDAVNGEYDEYSVKVGNFFKGHWINHPAQFALHQVPQPLRAECLDSFLSTRQVAPGEAALTGNYMNWLESAFGPTFAHTFPAVYTMKYWTVEASELTTDWVGQRIPWPSVQDVIDGSLAPLPRNNYYIDKVRYPRSGGYQSFALKMAAGSNLRLGAQVAKIDLAEKVIWLSTGERLPYSMLINTIPLPRFVALCGEVPQSVREAAAELSCSQLTLVEAYAPQSNLRPENWIYVYDEDLLSTRLNFTEKLTPGNAPPGWTGVQAEVYSSRHKPLPTTPDNLGTLVLEEMIHMEVLDPSVRDSIAQGVARVSTRSIPWANVIFHHKTRPALNKIWEWLEAFGLDRDQDDTHPLTIWPQSGVVALPGPPRGTLFMGGRYGQWKYFWSDDCVLRGREIAIQIGKDSNAFTERGRTSKLPLTGRP